MSTPSAQEIDFVAEQTSLDVRHFCKIWNDGGAAALDAAIRADHRFGFAVLDNHSGRDSIAIIAMRAADRVLLAFEQDVQGKRRVVAYGLDAFRGCAMTTDPELVSVDVFSGNDSVGNVGDTPAGALAAELAWRFDVGVSAALIFGSSDFHLPPADFMPFSHANPTIHGPQLIAALDDAAAMLGGHTSFTDGMKKILGRLWLCGLSERDPDLFGIYSVSSQSDDLDMSFEYNRKTSGADWTWDKELASFESFARKEAEPYCRSLIDRFRGPAFASLPHP